MTATLARPDVGSRTSSTAVDDARAPTVRPLRADDIERIRRFYHRLSVISAYNRYFIGGRPGDRELRRLYNCDSGTRDVIVAAVGDEIVGLAEGVQCRDRSDVVDIGVVVADAWQGKGIGLKLIHALVEHACARGARVILADTLADNRAIACLLRRVWPDAKPARDGSLYTWQLDVASALLPHSPA